ncbi:MAG: carbon-nitrogen hydrolase family protein [Firmicutes bacterium]|nr:carbon-nitrogen hydrolase family protein [Bacillota bacterium]
MIACVQMKLNVEDYRTEQSFAARIMDIMARVRQESGEGRLLVAFPEHLGTFCLLCNAPDRVWAKPSFAKASTALVLHHAAAVGHQMLTNRVSAVRALLLARSKEVERIYLSTFVKAARKYEAWIVAGSAALRWGQTNRIFNTSPVITPTGHVVYRQHKVNLVDMEGKGGLDLEPAPLNYVSAVQSPFGDLGVAICLDAFHLEVRQRLKGLGAKILVQPSANNGPWNEWQQGDWLRSSYQAVAENKEFDLAINPMLVGSLWDLEFEGQSSIIDQNGYVLKAQTATEEEILFKRDLLN